MGSWGSGPWQSDNAYDALGLFFDRFIAATETARCAAGGAAVIAHLETETAVPGAAIELPYRQVPDDRRPILPSSRPAPTEVAFAWQLLLAMIDEQLHQEQPATHFVALLALLAEVRYQMPRPGPLHGDLGKAEAYICDVYAGDERLAPALAVIAALRNGGPAPEHTGLMATIYRIPHPEADF